MHFKSLFHGLCIHRICARCLHQHVVPLMSSSNSWLHHRAPRISSHRLQSRHRHHNSLPIVPLVMDRREKYDPNLKIYDLFARLYTKEKTIFLFGEITDHMAKVILALLLNENAADKKGYRLYINSLGGSWSAGLAIYNTMQYIQPKVHTYCVGRAAGVASLLVAGGELGHRFIMPNAHMDLNDTLKHRYHEPDKFTNKFLKDNQIIHELYSKSTKQSPDTVADMLSRDVRIHPEEARSRGLVDTVLDHPVLPGQLALLNHKIKRAISFNMDYT